MTKLLIAALDAVESAWAGGVVTQAHYDNLRKLEEAAQALMEAPVPEEEIEAAIAASDCGTPTQLVMENYQCDGCRSLSQMAHWELGGPAGVLNCVGTTFQ